jgi:hypothetical protein
MPAPHNPDEERFAEISTALVDAVERVVPGWIERLVVERVQAWSGHVGPEVVATAAVAGSAACVDVVPRLRTLVETDLDHQRTNPLSLLRDSTRFAHAVLADLGVPAVHRDQFATRSFPDDDYGLVPASWDEVDPSLHEIGLTWGAAKAYLFKARRREEGRT